MFKLNKHRSERFGEKVEFKLSNLQAIKVPRGWDKLFLSILSAESGKIIAKTGKATVRSGNCQWTEAESIWVFQDDASKELEECLFKIVVSLASARSAVLGEVILNLADYASKGDSGPHFLPLNKCDFGTTLQVKIQCLTQKSKFRGGKSWKDTTYHLEDQNNNDDLDNKSDGSDNIVNRSDVSSSSNNLCNTSYPDEPGNRDTCFSASDSGDSFSRTAFSPRKNLNGGQNIRRQDSFGSHNSETYGAGPGDEPSKSDPSSFNSRASGSSVHTNQWQDMTAQTSDNGPTTPSLKPPDSSNVFLEAAEEIEELNDEVKMWERHSRQLKLDLENLKKEISEKSKHQANLDRQLSAAYNECDSLKLEVERLKAALEETLSKKADIRNVKNEDMFHLQKELEDELKYHKDSNANLTEQLRKTQESNIELVAILQELEEITEKQKLEIANLSQQNNVDEHEEHRSQKSLDIDVEWEKKLALKEEEIVKLEKKLKKKSLDIEAEWKRKLALKQEEIVKLEEKLKKKSLDNEAGWERKLALKQEEIVNLEEKLSNILNNEDQNEMLFNGSPDLAREVEVLKSKVNELEKDCAELTDENLDLILKLKELNKDLEIGDHLQGPRSTEFHDHIASSNCEYENGLLKSKIYELEDGLISKQVMTAPLSAKLEDIEKVSADLEIELQHYKDEASDLEIKLLQSLKEIDEKNQELANLQQKINLGLDTDLEDLNASSIKGFEEVESFSSLDMQNVLSEMDKQIRLALAQERKLISNDSPDPHNACGSDIDYTFSGTDIINQKNQVEGITKNLHELNALLRENTLKCNSISQHVSSGFDQRSFNDTESPEQIKDKSSTAKELGKAEKKTKRKGSIEDEFLSTFLEKEQEIDRLGHSNKELEDLICNLQKEKYQLEEDLASLHRENTDTSKLLQEVEHDLLVLHGDLELHVSANKTLERKSMELECCKNELAMQISELEQENVKLSERICGLEAQLRYLTNEKESNRLELEETISLAEELKDEVEQQKAEMEIQKAELKQKLQETQKLLSEALEELDLSIVSNSNLQATIEGLIEESSSLQKLTGELKRQKLELHEHITRLEIELDESKKKNFDFCKQVDLLELKLSSLQKDIASKEKSLLSELERIFQDHKEHEERIGKAHILLNKIELEKTVEVENLEKEIASLTAQMSSNHDEREIIALNAVREASVLRSDKAKLECSLQEVNSKIKLYETDLQSLQQESNNKIQGLVDSLNASKQSEEMLMADFEHTQRVMDCVKSSEEKYKKLVNDLELKLKASDYEKEQVVEEISGLKVQAQKLSQLQNSVLELKSSLDEANFEKRKLEELLKSVSEEHEELKSEKDSLMEKVSNMQKALCNGEDDRRSKIVLQEKLIRLESDLSVKEASYAQEIELKNELNRIKWTNSEYWRKVQSLEQENVELIKKMQIMEKELILRKSSHQDDKVRSEDDKMLHDDLEPHGSNGVDHLEVEANNMGKEQRVIPEEQADHPEVLVNENTDKISSLEAELRYMKERYLHMSLQYAEVEAQREELVMQLKNVKKEKRWFS